MGKRGRPSIAPEKKKRPRSLSVHPEDLERWQTAQDELGLPNLNDYIQRAANKLAMETIGGHDADVIDQVSSQTDKLDALQAEVASLRKDLQALTRALAKSPRQLEPA